MRPVASEEKLEKLILFLRAKNHNPTSFDANPVQIYCNKCEHYFIIGADDIVYCGVLGSNWKENNYTCNDLIIKDIIE